MSSYSFAFFSAAAADEDDDDDDVETDDEFGADTWHSTGEAAELDDDHVVDGCTLSVET